MRSVACKFRVSASTVKFWVDRTRGQRLDRVNFSDLSSAPRKVHNRTTTETEKLVLSIRQQLRDQSDLGEFGAAAILRELDKGGHAARPRLRPIGYILARAGALDYRRRVRRPPPAAGWYVPALAAGLAELDQFDFVEGLVIEGGIEVEVMNAISLHGGLVGSWPGATPNFNASNKSPQAITNSEKPTCVTLPEHLKNSTDDLPLEMQTSMVCPVLSQFLSSSQACPTDTFIYLILRHRKGKDIADNLAEGRDLLVDEKWRESLSCEHAS